MSVLAGFIALDVTAMLLAAGTVLGLATRTPEWFFTVSTLAGVARIGTALCQLSVFLPPKRKTYVSVVPVAGVPVASTGSCKLAGPGVLQSPDMQTFYLEGENKRLKKGPSLRENRFTIRRRDSWPKLISSAISPQASTYC